jgi:hypothetical protein
MAGLGRTTAFDLNPANVRFRSRSPGSCRSGFGPCFYLAPMPVIRRLGGISKFTFIVRQRACRVGYVIKESHGKPNASA